MKPKARVFIYVCTNATGTLKIPLAFIGKAKKRVAYERVNLLCHALVRRVHGQTQQHFENGSISFLLQL